MDIQPYLQAGFYTDSDHPEVRAFALAKAGPDDRPLKERLQALYLAVRDGFAYNPYEVILKPEVLKASHLLGRSYGYCIEKSNLFAAAARSLGIPSRLGFADVRNHLGTAKLERYLKSDVLVFHGYAELWLENRWVKATPVFDAQLCTRLGVEALDFDGSQDSIFQASDKQGNPFMEYVRDHGTYADLPYQAFREAALGYYRDLFRPEAEVQPEDKLRWVY